MKTKISRQSAVGSCLFYALCFSLTFAFCLLPFFAFPQGTAINTSGAAAAASSILDVTSTDKGVLIPRMTTAQRNAIAFPATGLLIFNTDCIEFQYYNSTTWISMINATSGTAPIATAATNLQATSLSANWNSVTGASVYYLDVSIASDFSSFVTGYNNLNVGNVVTYSVTGLTCGTTYYYRLRAGNTCSTSSSSGSVSSVTSICIPTITCGSQQIMATNLDIGVMISGTPAGQQQTNNGTVEKYCYDNLPSNCATYGGLYEWGEVMNYVASGSTNPSGIQGICPSGFHLPSDLELSDFEYCIESTIVPTGSTPLVTFQTSNTWRGTAGPEGPGAKMKDNIGWNGTNVSGFSALPAGARSNGGGFQLTGTDTFYWTTTQFDASRAWYRDISTTQSRISRIQDSKFLGLSVRCFKD